MTFAIPFDHPEIPAEPPVGAVLAFQRKGPRGKVLDYVALRSGDGLWYVSGQSGQTGMNWQQFVEKLRQWKVEVLRFATAWDRMEIPRIELETAEEEEDDFDDVEESELPGYKRRRSV